jgi:O-antigen/teichoic acid export membrane protein
MRGMALRRLRRSRQPQPESPIIDRPAADAKNTRRRGFIHNVLALYGVQACTYALPLLTFPYLARVLGPSGWGVVVFAQAIGDVTACAVEYGFDISASRETSRHRDDPERLSALISGVLGAKVLLALVCIAGALFPGDTRTILLPPWRCFGLVQSGASARALICCGSFRAWSACAWPVCLR